MPTELPAARIAADVRRARADLLGGRGPGAGDDEIAAHTRNRVVIAGMTATRRLELAARQTALARRDTTSIIGVIQLDRGELAGTLTELTRRLGPRHLACVARAALWRDRRGARIAPFTFGGIAVVLLLRRRRRSADPVVRVRRRRHSHR